MEKVALARAGRSKGIKWVGEGGGRGWSEAHSSFGV